jgi:hypothetical protein
MKDKWDQALWQHASPFQDVKNFVVGSPVNDFAVQFRAYWSNEGLHVLVLVEDAMLIDEDKNDGKFGDDLVEIYMDSNLSRGTSRDQFDDYHFLFGWGDKVALAPGLGSTQLILYEEFTTPNGYGMEINIHWGSVNTKGEPGKVFGLDVNVNDDDDGGGRERQVAWTNNLDTNFQDPSAYGRVRLVK